MQLHELINTFGQDLKQRHGQKIHKLSIHGAFTCPNRDGTLGRGGCTFCNVSSFADESAQQLSVVQQLLARWDEVTRARRYLAYFQAYTSTYAEVEYLQRMYEEALSVSDMVGLCVGTRPDCVPDAVLDLLAGYQARGYEVWLELGLQSANDKTLQRINRGHGYAAYVDAVTRAHLRGIKVCAHLIVGLPGEAPMDSLETLHRVVETGVEGIKLHPLHVVEGSTLGKAWQAGRLDVLTMEQYVAAAVAMIQYTPPEVVYHRVSASARRPTLLAPAWCENRWSAMTAIAAALARSGPQGHCLGRPFSLALSQLHVERLTLK
ncbi:TIGR01212 family radical SAM protein [Aeromonas caviae]|uniref:TIGR01212 family radical SAM protein n=1 Tax=Aeromonas caviae TaxID=648 RepID=UPI00309F6D5D